MKTREEVAELMRNWSDDPCWDLDRTPGFESYAEELRIFQHQQEQAWDRLWELKMLGVANLAGVAGNVELATFLWRIMERIAALEAKNER